MTAPVSPVISDEEIVGELRAAWAEVSRGYARCWAAMVEVARRTTTGWETAEIAAALTFTPRRADYELSCAHTLLEHLPRVYAALASGELDHHKARVFTDYLSEVTPAQAERICARLVPVAPGWTTGNWPPACCAKYTPSIPTTPAAPTSRPCAGGTPVQLVASPGLV